MFFHLFPFNNIPTSSRIVIYGAGRVGEDYCRQINAINYCSILFVADMRHSEMSGRFLGIEVRSPDEIANVDYDYVAIASVREKYMEEMQENLSRIGVPKEKIIVRKHVKEASLFSASPALDVDAHYIDEYRPMILEGVRDGINPFQGTQRAVGIADGILRGLVLRDPLFRQALAAMNGRSIVTIDRLINIFLILKFHLNSGCAGSDIVEFGSYMCGSAIFMAYLASRLYPGMNIYALDTFEGMVLTDKRIDAHNEKDFADADMEEIVEYLGEAGITNLIPVKGPFEQTASVTLAGCKGVCLAHIDCDIYDSVVCSYQAVKPHMVDGGYIIFDDATTGTCLGATKAVEDILYHQERKHTEQMYPHMVFRSFDRS